VEAPALPVTHKHYTRLEKPTRHKHSSLLQKSVNYSRKKFYNIDTRTVSDVLTEVFNGYVVTLDGATIEVE
jgi:hypothetical protein